MRIGLTELILIIIVALALIKPEKLKEYAASFGKALKIVREEKDRVQAEIIEPIKDDINSVKEPIDDIVEPVREVRNFMQSGI